MTDGKRTIQVTDEEYDQLMRLREELRRKRALGEKVEELPGGRRSAEFAMGAVAGIAAYWLYKELLEDEEEAEEVSASRRKARGARRSSR